MAGMGKEARVFVMPAEVIEDAFPFIRAKGYRITSEETSEYNCFAWGVLDKSRWWSPSAGEEYYWPDKVPNDLEVETFCLLYKLEGGFVPCSSEKPEHGFEKIAIYSDSSGDVTHVARQTKTGKWTSKLGDWEDIEHNTLDALSGDFYGEICAILKRPIQ